MILKDGGYFYRHYPNITIYRVPQERNEMQREFQFGPPPQPALVRINTPFLYGKFLKKYNDKAGLIVELEVVGEISLTDKYTGAYETRELTSHLVIVVPDKIYQYPFLDDRIYRITTDEVNEIN